MANKQVAHIKAKLEGGNVGEVLDIYDEKALHTVDIANNLTTTTTGKVLDATQGKALKDQADTTSSSLTVLTSRVNNIANLPSGSTTGDAELIDIRVKDDGTTASSAGNAVREQISDIKKQVLVEKEPFDWLEEATSTSPLGWHTGAYKASDGTINYVTSAMRTVGLYSPDDSVKSFTITAPTGYYVSAFEYDEEGVYQRNYGSAAFTGGVGTPVVSVIVTKGYGYKFTLGRFTDSSEYITEEFIDTIVLTPYSIVYGDLIGNEELNTNSKTITGAINELNDYNSIIESSPYNEWAKYGTETNPTGWTYGYYSVSDGTYSGSTLYIRNLRSSLYNPDGNVVYFTVKAPEDYYVSVAEYDSSYTFISGYGSANSDNANKTTELTVFHTAGHLYGITIGKFISKEDSAEHLTSEFISLLILTEYYSQVNLITDKSFKWTNIGSLTNPDGWTSGYRNSQTGDAETSDEYIRNVSYRYCPNDLVKYFGVNSTLDSVFGTTAIAAFEYDENNNFIKKHGEMDSTSPNATSHLIIKHTKGHKYSFCMGKFDPNDISDVITAVINRNKLIAIKVDDNGAMAKEERRNHLNIMIFGNSYAADSWGYVPFILKKYGITSNIYIYYRGSGSIDRLVAEWEDRSLTGLDAWEQSHVRRAAHIDTRYTDAWDSVASGYSAKDILEFANDPTKQIDKWDIISLQQGGRQNAFTVAPGAPDPRVGTEPYLRQVINLINQSYDRPYNLAWFATYSAIKPYPGNPSKGFPAVSGESIDDRVNTLKASETIFHAEPFNIVFPVGAAIYSARTNPQLASTDVSAIGNYWCPDAVHLDAGIPSYTASCTIIQTIFNKFFPGLSILNDDTIVTDALITSWACRFVNNWQGPVKSTSEDLYALARKCAVNACNNPFDIVPVYLPTDTTDLVMFDEHEDRYWADELIDTSHIINGEYVE